MRFHYRTRKMLVGIALLVVTATMYIIAIPSETSWLGKDGHLYNLSLGLVTGVVVLLFQFLVDNQRDRDFEELEMTRIKRVLASRDKEEYYRELIREARTEIVVFGVTASRFLNDFADGAHPAGTKRELYTALQRGVSVRFLLASREFLSTEGDRSKYDDATQKLNALKTAHSPLLEVRCYKHTPTLSMVVADKNFLVGPVFEGKESKHTTTIHALAGGEFATEYWNNFEKEWKVAVERS